MVLPSRGDASFDEELELGAGEGDLQMERGESTTIARCAGDWCWLFALFICPLLMLAPLPGVKRLSTESIDDAVDGDRLGARICNAPG